MTKRNSPWPADQIERRAVSELVPAQRNPRTHSPEQVAEIAASMREWGWTVPVLIDEQNQIIAGHGRIQAAEKLEIDEVPVMVAKGWSDAQKKAYAIADNKLAINAGWDMDLLRLDFEELHEWGFDCEVTGFDKIELTPLLGQADKAGFPGLSDKDREPFQQMTFILHDSQVESVQAAINAAKRAGPFDTENENNNGNALARICEAYLASDGQS